MRRILGVVLVGVALACSVGPRPDRFPPARGPAGATIRLRLHRGRERPFLTGELLAVQDSALLVRDSSAILLVPNRTVITGELLVSGGLSFTGRPTSAIRDRLRLLSRYPSGLSGALLGSLLAAYGRDSVETVH
jgi:hypothetical protein